MSDLANAEAVDKHSGQYRLPFSILIVGMLLPTVVTWIYFVALSSYSPALQKGAYGIGKIIQFALPLLAWWLVRNHQVSGPRNHPSVNIKLSLLWGSITGLLIGAAILGLYTWVLLPNGLMDGARNQAKSKLQEIGMATPAMLLTVGLFYSLFHSGLEEYYWRWFVFRNLEDRMPVWFAIGLSSLGFMLHHVLVLARYFDWSSPITYLFSLGVATGGAIWALIYRSTGSLYGAWLSHLFVDAAIFVVGYWLVF